MTEVLLIWDSPLFFENLFREHNIKCQRVISESIGTPFIPACKCIIIPTGFANREYTNILPGLKKNAKRFENFIRKGGNLVIFSPMVDKYVYDWLPMELEYIQQQQVTTICTTKDNEAQCLVENLCSDVEFDGYFSKTDGEIIFSDKKGKALMVVKQLGKGKVIATTIHEFPSVQFLKWVDQNAKSTRL